jgi:YidC/Oxa1 family membrane protein insertase
MDKNTILAIGIIFVIVLAFQFIFLRPRLRQLQEQQVQQEEVIPEERSIEEPSVAEEEEEIEETRTVVEDIVTPEGAPEEKIVTVDTDNYLVNISTAGGSITSFKLKNYLDSNDAPVELVGEYDEMDILPFDVYFNRLGNITPGERDLYHVEMLSDTAYTFYRDFQDDNGNPFRLSKSYYFQNNEYVFDLKIKVTSLGSDDLFINRNNVSYTLAWGPLLGPTSVVRNRYNITTQGYHEGGKFHKVLRGAGGCSLRRSEAKYIEISRVINWIGVTNRYFFIGVIPDQKNYIFSFDQRTQGKYAFGVSHPYFRGYEFEDEYKIYTGPKDRTLLKKYGNDFESVKSARVLKPIVIFLEIMIKFFYRFTNSYGVAIILMTIVIKVILHPLTRKSFQSMRRMSALQPKITELRDKYKNDPQGLNKATSALYKKEKVNPMGGCLPMILQLPIFYALYTLLSGMVELRNESFLWIKDLSLPDTVATIKMAVPLLGYKLTDASGVLQGYTDINILPFVMTGTTLLQSKLTSGGQTAQQGKMMTYLFPIMFFFIFWNMPSGLVLYWTIQNILTIGQQYYIDYRLKKKGQIQPDQTKIPEKTKTLYKKRR